jgi:hypothetical protein
MTMWKKWRVSENINQNKSKEKLTTRKPKEK